jgi:cytochrome b561
MPPLETTWLSRPSEIASRVSHRTFYALLLVVPFVGIVVRLRCGNALSIFGLW